MSEWRNWAGDQVMEWEPYFRAVEAIMDGHRGRPHWGKCHFQAVRDRLDPGRKLTNAHVERVLGA